MLSKNPASDANPQEFFNEKWKHLEEGLNRQLRAFETKQGTPPKEWWSYHDACYHMCVFSEDTFKMPDRLYPKIAETLSAFVSAQANRLKELAKTATPEALLKEYLQLYNAFVASSTSVRKISTYMHRFWIPQHKNEMIGGVQVREVIPLSYVLWREKCFVPIKAQLLKAVLQIIYEDRSGSKVDMTLVRTLLHSFDAEALGTDDKGFYEREFENIFLDATQAFYLQESTSFLAANGVHEYMRKAESRIEQEQANCKAYYLSPTEAKLKSVLNDVLVSKHMEPMQASFAEMLQAEQLDAMKRLCFLLSRVPEGLPSTAKTYEAYLVRTIGASTIDPQAKRDPKDALTNAVPFVRQLIDVYKKYLGMTENCFANHTLFKAAVDKAFQALVNRDTGKWSMSRLLTIFVDHILKGKEKDIADDAAIDDVLDSVVGLFGYLTDKDEFEEISRKSLARRLLNSAQTFNEGWERMLITKLKARHGDAFTRRLQGMFSDSQDETIQRQREKFEAFNDGSAKVGQVALQVQVLNECFWPLSGADKVPVVGLPLELSNCVERFEAFYKKDTQNRKLKWIFNHGSVQMGADYGKGKQLLLVISPLQACILLCFNSSPKLALKDIYANMWPGEGSGAAALRSSASSSALIDIKLDDQLKHAIQPLIAGGGGGPKDRVKILDTEGDMDKLSMTDTITAVDKMGPVKRKKIVFAARSAVAGTAADVKEDNQMIMKQREFEVDAAIVRILKTRNVVKWNTLQIDVVDALKSRFAPPVSLLKKRLESLIDRKFAERDENDRNLIKYIA